MTGILQRIKTLRPITIAVVLGLIAVVLLATIWFDVPYWLDVARMEVILLTVFGVPVALVAGRPAYRVALATVLLVVGMAVQIVFGYLREGPGCGTVLSQLAFAIVFGTAMLLYNKFGLAGIVIAATLFAYGVLSRTGPLVRLGAVAALLIAVFVAALIISEVQAASMSHRCIDF